MRISIGWNEFWETLMIHKRLAGRVTVSYSASRQLCNMFRRRECAPFPGRFHLLGAVPISTECFFSSTPSFRAVLPSHWTSTRSERLSEVKLMLRIAVTGSLDVRYATAFSNNCQRREQHGNYPNRTCQRDSDVWAQNVDSWSHQRAEALSLTEGQHLVQIT